MFKKMLNWTRRLAGKFSQHRTLMLLIYLCLMGLTLPAFYPLTEQRIVSTHNGFLLGLGVLGFLFLTVLDATALYDEDNLDKLVDAWVDLSGENQRLVIDFAHNTLDDQKIKELQASKYKRLAEKDPEAFNH